MTFPDHGDVAQALNLIATANDHAAVHEAASRLADSLGMSRFILAEVTTSADRVVHSLVHNAPPRMRDVLSTDFGLDMLPVMGAAMQRRVPFLWGPGDSLGPLFDEHAAQGYGCGVAASSASGTGRGVGLVMSRADAIDATAGTGLLAYGALAAAQFLAAFDRIRRAAAAGGHLLSERELQCLLHVLAGRSAKETARDLGLGPRTVVQYLERARAKLGAKTSMEAASAALRRGWIDYEDAVSLAASAPTRARQA